MSALASSMLLPMPAMAGVSVAEKVMPRLLMVEGLRMAPDLSCMEFCASVSLPLASSICCSTFSSAFASLASSFSADAES